MSGLARARFDDRVDFVIEETVAAPAATVFEVLTDHRGYPSITPIRRVRLDPEGDPVADGVGAVRVVELIGPPIRERVTEYEPEHRFAYEMLSGAPLKNYRALVETTGAGGCTTLRYAVHAEPKLPLIGHAAVLASKLLITSLVRGIKREAEARAGAGSR